MLKLEGRVYDSTPPQLKSLALFTSLLLASIKLHINELRSLKYKLCCEEVFSELVYVRRP